MCSVRHLLAVDDLNGEDVAWIMARSAMRLQAAERDAAGPVPGMTAALLFLEPSLRTRLGFAVAVQRLGGNAVDVFAARFRSDMSAPEGLDDTLRVVTDMVDVTVARVPGPLPQDVIRSSCASPVVCGGDGGGNHPTQALIDLFALRKAFGTDRPLRVGLCGDLTMRAPRSLMAMLAFHPLARLVAYAPATRVPDGLPRGLAGADMEIRTDDLDCRDLDVLYVAGLPERAGDDVIPAGPRQRFALTADRLRQLPAHAAVLSPMPVIDEIAPECWKDPRVKVLEQSRDGVAVRMAVLEYVLGCSSVPASG